MTNKIEQAQENNRERMKLISVHLPEWMITNLEKLVAKGVFPSRSEAIRVAICLLLNKFEDMITDDPRKRTANKILIPGR